MQEIRMEAAGRRISPAAECRSCLLEVDTKSRRLFRYPALENAERLKDNYVESVLTLFVRRDLYRRAVFFVITPFLTDLSITPNVSGSKALASAAFPPVMAMRSFFSCVFRRWRFI